MAGLLSALLVLGTSLFQFTLEPIAVGAGSRVPAFEQGTELPADSKADDDNQAARSICTIQAVSQGVQLHVSYEPLAWESFDNLEIPELKVEVPRQFYKAGWEYFRVLFTDIIAANAP